MAGLEMHCLHCMSVRHTDVVYCQDWGTGPGVMVFSNCPLLCATLVVRKGLCCSGAIAVIILSILAAIVLPKMGLSARQPQEKPEQIAKIENAYNNRVQWTIC